MELSKGLKTNSKDEELKKISQIVLFHLAKF